MPLSARVPDVGALDVLLSVARLGSLGQAAKEHGITQPAVASRIKHLEGLLGMTLVERSPAGCRLTEDGVIVSGWARRVVDAAAAFDVGMTALRDRHSGRIRLACSMTIAEYLAPSWLVELRRRRPLAQVGMAVTNTAAVLELVLAGQVDIGFVEGPEEPEGVRCAVVAHDELVLVVDPHHPWAHRTTPVPVHDLAATPLVTREPGSGTRHTVDRVLAVTGRQRPHPVVELSSTTAIKAAVGSGIGPAVLSWLAVADDVAAGRLVAVPTAGADLRRALRVVWPRGRRLSPVLRDVVAVASAAPFSP